MIQCPPGSQPVRVRFTSLPVAVTYGVPKPVGWSLYYLNSGPGVATMAAFKAALDAAIAGPISLALSVGFLAPKIVIRDLTQYYNPDVIFPASANGAYAGAVTGDALPIAAAVNYEKQSAQSGKINRGQLFLPGVAEDNQDQGELTAGAVTLYNNVAAALKLSITAGGQVFVPTIFSPTLSNLVLGVAGGGVWMQPIVLFDLDKEVTGLKRRKPKSLYVV